MPALRRAVKTPHREYSGQFETFSDACHILPSISGIFKHPKIPRPCEGILQQNSRHVKRILSERMTSKHLYRRFFMMFKKPIFVLMREKRVVVFHQVAPPCIKQLMKDNRHVQNNTAIALKTWSIEYSGLA